MVWDYLINGFYHFLMFGSWWHVGLSIVGMVTIVTLHHVGLLGDRGGDAEWLRIERQHQWSMANLLVEQTRLMAEMEKARTAR